MVRLGLSRQIEKIPADFARTFSLLQNDLDHPLRWRIQFGSRDELCVAEDPGQRIFHLLHDTCGQTANARHLLHMGHLPAKLNFICDFCEVDDFQVPVVQRNGFQVVGSAAGQLKFVSRNTLNTLDALEQVGECGIGHYDSAGIVDYRDRDGNQSE